MVDRALQDAVAIVGLAARFPGGYDAESLWSVLKDGETTATRFARQDLDPSLGDEIVTAENYVPVRGVLPDAECFDAEFFDISKREAEALDPQQRVFLELAVHALENAGYYRDTRSQMIGLYASLSNITYYRDHLAARPEVIARIGDLNAMMGNEKDYLATRVAHKLDLTGPCVNVSTACSSSAVAIAEAFNALRSFRCDTALAGGISITTPQHRGYVFQEGSILSPDGVCRPFDERAQGTFFSNGGGIVVLKRLEDALADGDSIRAVLRGAGINNDGARRASFAAPGVDGQADAIGLALADADLSAEQVAYVEAHGTATPIGDPIEVEALTLAFREHTDRRGYCGLGSVKSNLGHLDVAAGVAGVIKVVLSMQHGVLPPNANFRRPNPELRLGDSPFFVNDRCVEWPDTGGPKIAGVSSFGSGGTNAHLILQEAPDEAIRESARDGHDLILLSARSRNALKEQVRTLSDHVANTSDLRLDDLAFTLRHGRTDRRYRTSFAASSVPNLQGALKRGVKRAKVAVSGSPKKLAFVFPGQGAQYAGMGAELYADMKPFRVAIDRCFELFDEHLEAPLRQIVFAEDPALAGNIDQTRYAQPALFTLGFALAEAYGHYGIRPAAMIGHSIGEYVAACIAGVFSLEDAAAIVARRGALMQSMPPGAMLAVVASAEEVEEYLSPTVRIAAVNAGRSTVVAGDFPGIEKIEAELSANDLMSKRLRTSHAFHSSMMEPAARDLAAFIEGYTLNDPVIPFVSTVTGRWIENDEATDAAYWGNQIRKPVLFRDAAAFLLEQGPWTCAELGPRCTATKFIQQLISDDERHAAFAAFDTENGEVSECDVFFGTFGRLWERNHDVDWNKVAVHNRGRRIPLPGYSFERTRHWIEAAGVVAGSAVAVADSDRDTPAEGAGDTDALRILIADTVGIEADEIDDTSEFVDLGFDSLLLTQFSIALKSSYGVDVPFRRLLEDLGSYEALSNHLREQLPDEKPTKKKTVERKVVPIAKAGSRGAVISAAHESSVSVSQRRAVAAIVDEYNRMTPTSKTLTAANRGVLSDPRTVAGFNPLWKEAVYPIVTNRSKGAYLWDVDGNRFIDFTCGFGPILLGHGPEFLNSALISQIDAGVETGPQTALAYEVARLIQQATGVERVAFASTGTEAVIAAVRIARTVSARDKIVIFSESYHGIHDEVTLNPRHVGAASPGAPGIPRSNLENVLVARYGSDDALALIAEHADDVAAVLVEPVQSRNPELRPRDFLHRLREFTQEKDIALIFDEIVTGFRVAIGGAQEMYDVDADIVTYGKVIGGGYPVGVVAGKGRYLDALDGGDWQFGDDSMPEVGVTFFAGTFVRHPLMLAAARSTLEHLLEQGPTLQQKLNARTRAFTDELKKVVRQTGVAIKVSYCSSWLTLVFADTRFAAMFYVLMRKRGIFLWEGRAIFLNTAHSDADLNEFVGAFESSLVQMLECDLIEKGEDPNRLDREAGRQGLVAHRPPVPGARLGRDPNGVPGWYVEDPEQPGRYRLLDVEDVMEGEA